MKKSKPTHIVIDTNVIISAAILPHSSTAQALTLAFDHFVLAQSEPTWDELVDRIQKPRLDRYFPQSYERAAFLIDIVRNVEFFDVKTTVTDCSDPTDNKFLALALDAGAGTIVTGDNALKKLHPYRGIDILSPADFARQYE